jgi:Peptidase C39 family
MDMSADLPTEQLREPVVSCDTALSCLVWRGVCKVDDPEIEAIRRHAVLDGNTLPASRLVELVGKFGRQAECARLDWNELTKSELGDPILVFLKNTNVVVVTGTDSAAAEAVSVWDPLHTDGGVLSVPREDFERAWNGDALVIAQQPSTGAEASLGSSREGIEILDPPPEDGAEQAPMAKAQLLPGSVPVGRLAKSRRLAAIGLVAAVGIGVPLWLHAVTDNLGTTGMQAKEEIPEAPETTLSPTEATVQPRAPDAAASPPSATTPQVAPSGAMPTQSEPPGGPAAALVPTTAAPMPEPAPAIATPVAAEPPTGPAFAATPVAATPSVNTDAAPPRADSLAVEPRLAATEISTLLARGDVLFSTGDLAGARLFYERAADAGEARAAVRLGETYDPIFLDHSHLRGVRGDVETALSWYRRARDLGAAEAEVLLNSLQAK